MLQNADLSLILWNVLSFGRDSWSTRLLFSAKQIFGAQTLQMCPCYKMQVHKTLKTGELYFGNAGILTWGALAASLNVCVYPVSFGLCSVCETP